jgi:ATP-dependent DNA ligase
LAVSRAYLDGELCAVRADGTTFCSLMQAATDGASAGGLVYFVFDLLHSDSEDLRAESLLERTARLAQIMRAHPARCNTAITSSATARPSSSRPASSVPGGYVEARECAVSAR